MSAWLIFFSLFVKQVTHAVPQPFTVLPFFAFVAYLIFRSQEQKINPLTAKIIPSKVLLYFALLTVSEIMLLIWNYSKFGSTSQDFNILGSFIGFCSTIFSILLIYLVLYYSINDDRQMKLYIHGTMVTFGFLAVAVIIPQLFVASDHNLLEPWVNFIDRTFAPRWRIPQYYTSGSYTATMGRANGIEIEPAFLAGQLAIVFLPWILSAVKNHYLIFQKKFFAIPAEIYSYILLAIILLTFVLAKTTTGLVAIGITALILVFDTKAKMQRFFVSCAVAGLILATIAYFVSQSVRNFLDGYLFAKGGQSASNRSGGTIGLFLTFLHYPLFGVGNGYIGHYLMEYVPRNSRLNNEYINGFSHNYVVLSNWGGFLAQYGIIFTLPIIRKVRELFYNFDHAISQDSFGFFVKDAAKYTMIFFAVLALFDFNWLSYYSLISVFVFGRFVQYRMSAKQVVKS